MVSVFYVVFFLLVNGEPVVVNYDYYFDSLKECISYSTEELNRVNNVLTKQPESYATAICIGKHFDKLGKS